MSDIVSFRGIWTGVVLDEFTSETGEKLSRVYFVKNAFKRQPAELVDPAMLKPCTQEELDAEITHYQAALTVALEALLMVSARTYLDARQAQELDHTDPDLNWARTEAHDQFLAALDAAGIPYTDREHGARIAFSLLEGDGGRSEKDDRRPF